MCSLHFLPHDTHTYASPIKPDHRIEQTRQRTEFISAFNLLKIAHLLGTQLIAGSTKILKYFYQLIFFLRIK